MAHPDKHPSSLIACFDEFYKQVLRQKHVVLSKPWKKEEGKTSLTIAEEILSKLETCLKEQESKTAPEAKSHYKEAQFIMASLADEVFLNLKWPGKTYWESHLLEQRLYGTHSAGQTFFTKLEKLLKDQDPTCKDLALIFLNALALGFQGKHRHFEEAAILNTYRDHLFVFVNQKEPALFQEDGHLFPEAYAHTIEGRETKQLPNKHRFSYIFAALGTMYLLASCLIWYSTTGDLSHQIDHMIADNDKEN